MKFSNLTRFQQIGISVLVGHLLIVLLLLVSNLGGHAPKKRIAVRTITALPPPKPVVVKPKKVVELQKKKVVAAAVAPKKKEKELWEQISENLKAIASENRPKEPEFSVAIPKAIEIKEDVKPGYGQAVAAILQDSLELPEFGEVVVKIEIDAKGRVEGCEILKTVSSKNAEFLKNRLQELLFPCFNEFGLTENKLDFTITFHNAENR